MHLLRSTCKIMICRVLILSCQDMSCTLEKDAWYKHHKLCACKRLQVLLCDKCLNVGSRAKVYTLIYSAGLTGMAVGPLIAAAAFAYTGNKWHVQTLQHVILVGLVLALVPVMVLMCFDDDKALGKESSAAMNLQLSAATSGDLTSGETAVTKAELTSLHLQILQMVFLQQALQPHNCSLSVCSLLQLRAVC